MIGVFDSGIGGLTALSELRKRAPLSDIIYLADRKNAPYGTKSECELTNLVTRDVNELLFRGADRILIACCTASTVYDLLPSYVKNVSTPIIEPAAKAAAYATKNAKIAVISTKRTADSHAFKDAIGKYSSAEVFEFEAQALVSFIEERAFDSDVGGKAWQYLQALLGKVEECGADSLILGCTHFPHLKERLWELIPKIKIIDPSLEGARHLLRSGAPKETGRTIYV